MCMLLGQNNDAFMVWFMKLLSLRRFNGGRRSCSRDAFAFFFLFSSYLLISTKSNNSITRGFVFFALDSLLDFEALRVTSRKKKNKVLCIASFAPRSTGFKAPRGVSFWALSASSSSRIPSQHLIFLSSRSSSQTFQLLAALPLARSCAPRSTSQHRARTCC